MFLSVYLQLSTTHTRSDYPRRPCKEVCFLCEDRAESSLCSTEGDSIWKGFEEVSLGMYFSSFEVSITHQRLVLYLQGFDLNQKVILLCSNQQYLNNHKNLYETVLCMKRDTSERFVYFSRVSQNQAKASCLICKTVSYMTSS